MEIDVVTKNKDLVLKLDSTKLNILLFKDDKIKDTFYKSLYTNNFNIKIDNEVEKFNISYLKDDSDILFNINILEDLKYGNPNYDEEYMGELIKLLGLDSDVLNKNYTELSKSEYRKVLIILTLLRKNKIIILDNPTIGLDEKSINGLIKILKNERRKDNIILITSNNSDFLLPISDNIFVIDENEVKNIDNKYDFFDNDKLLEYVRLDKPSIMKFYSEVKRKNIKLRYRDNISDLLKEIYINV